MAPGRAVERPRKEEPDELTKWERLSRRPSDDDLEEHDVLLIGDFARSDVDCEHTRFEEGIPMIKATCLFATGLLALLSCSANAGPIFDTGAPTTTGASEYVFGATQYFAGRFSLSKRTSIDRLEAYFHLLAPAFSKPDIVEFAIHEIDPLDGRAPGVVLQSWEFSSAVAVPFGWHGVSTSGQVFNAGSYWLSFRPKTVFENGNRVSDARGGMPYGAPRKFEEVAQGPGPGFSYQPPGPVPYDWDRRTAGYYDHVTIGARIFGTESSVPDGGSTAPLVVVVVGALLAARSRFS